MNTAHPESPPAGIYSAMAAIMGEVSPISKDKKNREQNFQYRGIDDVYNALNPLLAEHRVFMVPTVTGRATDERTTKNGNIMSCVTLTVEYRFFHADGSFITCTVMGEGRDTADKATNKAMAAAHKYALLQTFCIPTADLGRDDPDHETPEPLSSRNTTRIDLGAIRQTMAGLADVAALEAYWPKVSVGEDHPDYPQLASLFVARKKELLQTVPDASAPSVSAQPPAPPQKPHVTLDTARTAFAECATPQELESCARSLTIAKNNPEYEAISALYMERLTVLKTPVAQPPAESPPPMPPATPVGDITPEQITAIQTAYSGWPREERLADISQRTGRSINSVKELSLAEASALLECFAQPEAAA